MFVAPTGQTIDIVFVVIGDQALFDCRHCASVRRRELIAEVTSDALQSSPFPRSENTVRDASVCSFTEPVFEIGGCPSQG